jgi:transposase
MGGEMGIKKKRYTAAEKAKIALEAIKGELTIAEIVSRYETHPTQINKWRKQALHFLPEAFSGRAERQQENYAEQLAELYQQIGKLKVENDFLKKKSDLLT